ncbi:MAG TPA: response regulator [Labilithrix sp.]|jgi:DNA-binding response OmpR family regulator|nr:response regulator [Labilithrix sp.]
MSTDDKKPIGRILLKRRLISQDELDKQLETQKAARDGVPLASRLASNGVVPETEVLRALSEQFGVPGVDLNQLAIALEHLELVPREVAESRRVLPVLVREDRIFLAMGNPEDKRVIDELEFVTGRRIYPYVAISTTLERAIRDAYDAKDRGLSHYVGPNAPPAALERARKGEREQQDRRERESVQPGRAPSVVVDQQIQQVAAIASFSTNEFGQLGEEVSRVEMLTDELRNAAGLDPGAQHGAQGALRDRTSKRILVIDDEDDIRKLVRRILTERGHAVIEADRGLIALRLVKEVQPDLILLDAMLPEVHGFDIARRIKGSAKYGGIPILMMSAVYRGWRIAEDLKSSYGIEDYIEKPFRIADLLTRVDNLLANRGAAGSPHDPEAINREAAQYLEQGIAAYKAGEVDMSINLLKKGIAIDPLAYRLRYHLALIYGKRGQFYDGITELERAVDLNPRHFPALKNLAVLYEKAGFKNKAIEMWERCVHSSPDNETRESIKAHMMLLL